VTISDESEKEAPESEKFLAFVAPHVEEEDSYYSKHSENEEELKEAYKTLYKEFEKLREGRKQHLNDLNSLHLLCYIYVLVMESRNELVVPPVSLERTFQVSIGEDRKSRSSNYFFCTGIFEQFRCDLTFAYDVISILHVLFVFNNKKKGVFWGEFPGLFLLGLLDIVCIFT
jgi:hypothetical protein